MHCVYPDHNENLWLSSNNGLVKFNKTDHHLEIFYEEDGLPHSEFNQWAHFQDEQGQLYLGGVQGLIRFDPDTIKWKDNNGLFPIQIKDIKVYDRDNTLNFQTTRSAIDLAEITSIPANSHRVEIQLSVPYYGNKKVNRLWRTSISHPEWIAEASDKVVLYVPDFGQQDFEIKAYLAGQRHLSKSLTFRFCMPIPFYRSWWFITSAVIAILFLTV